MNAKLSFYVILCALVSAGIWGVNHTQLKESMVSGRIDTKSLSAPTSATSFRLGSIDTPASVVPKTPADSSQPHFTKIKEWLRDGRFRSAESHIDDFYSEFSSAELDALKLLFLQESTRSDARLEILRAATRIFDDLETWDALAQAAVGARDWQTGFTALMRASELENGSPALEKKLEDLVRASSYLRAELEKRGDELGIKELYQRAYELHPNYPRFQLELAYSHLRLDENDKASRLLSALTYDPELGEIAQQALTRIEEGQQPPTPTLTPTRTPTASTVRERDIVVPLLKSGNSFFVETTVDSQSTKLLLDTGASITALSTDLIERLDLRPTGQIINLSTANGSRQARLFKVDQLQLGRIRLTGLVIAEIDLPSRSGFQGLLGTDALNQLGDDYSYLIDNKENALIFRRR